MPNTKKSKPKTTMSLKQDLTRKANARSKNIELVFKTAYSNPLAFAKLLDTTRGKDNIIYTKEREEMFKDFMVEIAKFMLSDDDKDALNKMMINLAVFPRAGKSISCAIIISWLLGRKPDLKIIYVCASQELVDNLLRNVKDILNNPIYKQVFPDLEVHREVANAIHVRKRGDTRTQFSVYAAGINGTITGLGANIIITDDLYKSHTDALSPATNDKIKQTYFSAVRTRLEGRKTMEIHIGTRWTEDELYAVLENGGEYNKIIKYKAFDEENQVSNFPNIIDTKALKSIRDNDTMIFNSAYQQEYIDLEAKLFSIERFKRTTDRPSKSVDIIVMDTASGGGDYTAIVYLQYTPSGYMYMPVVIYTKEIYEIWLQKLNTMIDRLGYDIIFVENNKDPYLSSELYKKYGSKKNKFVKSFSIAGNEGHKHARIITSKYKIENSLVLNADELNADYGESKNEYKEFMKDLCNFVQFQSKHDDAPDVLSNAITQISKYESMIINIYKNKYGGHNANK